MKKNYDIMQGERVIERLFATETQANEYFNTMFDAKFNRIEESKSIIDIDSLEVNVDRNEVNGCISVWNGKEFIFELEYNDENQKFYFNNEREMSGDPQAIFSDSTLIVDPRKFFFIDKIKDAFICPNCDSGTVEREHYGSDSITHSTLHSCEHCESSSPFRDLL